MANTVTTSIVVQFTKGEGAGGVLLVEVDDREAADGGLNGGKTSFLPGDTVYLLSYQTDDVVVDAKLTSLGTLVEQSSVVIEKTEDITFAGETEVSSRYPVTGGALTSVEWFGANLGSISVVGGSKLRVPSPPPGVHAVGAARIRYNTTALVHRLSHSALAVSDYSIVVLFAGHTL